MSNSFATVFALALVLFTFFVEIVGEFCRDYGHECKEPYKCCLTHCCHNTNVHQDTPPVHFTFYRWHLWNMWYFWFIIIFILMSCFGGCGYYRRRRGLFFTSHHPRLSQPATLAEPRLAVPVYGNTRIHYHNGSDNMAFYPPFGPPPYADVVGKPELYPISRKPNNNLCSDLEAAQPPPYTATDSQPPASEYPPTILAPNPTNPQSANSEQMSSN